jgi:3-methyladenine DNA glycosylase AlkD
MQVEQILNHLNELADPRAVTIWSRMYASPEPYLGVNLTRLKGLAKEIKRNHPLALALWATAVHDAKLLATMIEDPKKVTEEQIDQQMMQVHTADLCDKYCSNVVAKTPLLLPKIKQWAEHSGEMYKRGGYMLIYTLARSDTLTEDEFFAPYLAAIQAEIAGERNWVREAMNYALIAIGGRTAQLNQAATAVARQIGPIEVDYGDTSCKAPDALASLAKHQRLEQIA